MVGKEKRGYSTSGAVDAVTGVFDTVTGDAFDLDKSKKKEKEARKQIEAAQKQAEKEKQQEKEKQKKSEIDFYESLRQGNLGLLKPKQNQTIG